MQDTPVQHGNCSLRGLRVDTYSLLITNGVELVGDLASQTAFREVLHRLQSQADGSGGISLHGRWLDDLSNEQLDDIVRGTPSNSDNAARHAIAQAIDEFSSRLAYVVRRFLAHPGWTGVERIAIGGGFKESAAGRMAIRRTVHRLAEEGVSTELRLLHYDADAAALVGWTQALPEVLGAPTNSSYLAVDIGGTNLRCGLVVPAADAVAGDAVVMAQEKWNHAKETGPEKDLVEGMVSALRRLLDKASLEGLCLSPFIGIACPGMIGADGSIERGAQNLPSDWQSASFHLPRRIVENIPSVQGAPTIVRMHNDAVMQGLSEKQWMTDVKRWAVLTIGTGLGNASFTNLS